MLIWFTKRSRNPEVSLDLVSEVFLTAFSEAQQFNGRTHKQACAWLWALAGRHWADYCRSNDIRRRAYERSASMDVLTMPDEEYERVEELASISEMAAVVRAGMSMLPKEQQTAVWLRVVDGQSYNEIADVLDITSATARARVSRGLRTLAETPGLST